MGNTAKETKLMPYFNTCIEGFFSGLKEKGMHRETLSASVGVFCYQSPKYLVMGSELRNKIDIYRVMGNFIEEVASYNTSDNTFKVILNSGFNGFIEWFKSDEQVYF